MTGEFPSTPRDTFEIEEEEIGDCNNVFEQFEQTKHNQFIEIKRIVESSGFQIRMNNANESFTSPQLSVDDYPPCYKNEYKIVFNIDISRGTKESITNLTNRLKFNEPSIDTVNKNLKVTLRFFIFDTVDVENLNRKIVVNP